MCIICFGVRELRGGLVVWDSFTRRPSVVRGGNEVCIVRCRVHEEVGGVIVWDCAEGEQQVSGRTTFCRKWEKVVSTLRDVKRYHCDNACSLICSCVHFRARRALKA